jgi:hypothetical protein
MRFNPRFERPIPPIPAGYTTFGEASDLVEDGLVERVLTDEQASGDLQRHIDEFAAAERRQTDKRLRPHACASASPRITDDGGKPEAVIGFAACGCVGMILGVVVGIFIGMFAVR